jgi:hypothetical protein
MTALNPSEPPNQPQQQGLQSEQPSPPRFTLHWESVFIATLTIILGYLTGPTVLLSWRIKKWGTCSTWDAEERQSSMDGSALLFLLLYIPIFLLRSQIAQLWTFVFSHLTQWVHLPQLAWVGQAAIWPLTPSTIFYRWLLALPLVYLLAYILQRIDKLVGITRREPVRVLLPEELAQLSSLGTRQKSTTKQRSRSTSMSNTSKQNSPSLWEQIDWNQVPDDDPLKQAVIEEAERNAVERYTQRVKAEVQQALLQQQIETNPLAQSNTSENGDDSGGYDWNQGDGSLKL